MARDDESSTKNLSDSRAEALQALLSSLSPGQSGQPNGGKLSMDQVRQLSDKLGEILGDSAEPGDGARRNAKGELVNEDGLPIIDINEPVTAADYAFRPDPDSAFDDPDLLPLWTLSPEEKARRKAERERILDLLEAEEQDQQVKVAEATRKRLEQELEKRREAAKDDMEKLKQARELQKKMGRALIRSVVESRDRAEQEKAEQEEQDRLAAAHRPLKPKKSVSFAETSPEEINPPGADVKGKGVDWGDVAPGTLRKPESSATQRDRPVMKMNVVERTPSGALRSPGPPPRDSDDESEPEDYGDVGSNDGDSDRDHHFDIDDDTHPPQSGSDDSGDDHIADEEPSEWNDEDFDTARHQREVALEYYEKRKTIGADVMSAMRAHTHGEDEWDQPEVPLEASLASAPPKPSSSRFKAERSSHPPPNPSSLASHSLGAAVLPSSSGSSLKRAIRMGKLENGKLVGGEEGDSEDEVVVEDDNAKELLEMLRRGEVTNIGPQVAAPSTPSDATTDHSSATETPAPADVSPDTAQVPKPSKVSRFKLSLGLPPSSSGQESPELGSAPQTPETITERSSPKLYAGNDSHADDAASSSSSHPLPRLATSRSISSSSLPPPAQPQRAMPGMIVDSPSFRPPRASSGSGASTQRGSAHSPAFHSVILESPSFTAPSPSSPSPSSTVVGTPVPSTPPMPSSSSTQPRAPPLRQGVVERKPPSVASFPVREQSGPSTADEEERKPKMSRFKAQRS